MLLLTSGKRPRLSGSDLSDPIEFLGSICDARGEGKMCATGCKRCAGRKTYWVRRVVRLDGEGRLKDLLRQRGMNVQGVNVVGQRSRLW